MGLDKGKLRDQDVYFRYPDEEVLFRYDGREKRAYRRFIGAADEHPVAHDNRLLNDALAFGEEIDKATYLRGGS
jgi:hypothetical protein